METLGLDMAGTTYRQTEESGLCPVCGAAMVQVDKLKEDGHIFIWLECSKRECEGQWLQKKSLFGGKEVLEK